MTRRSSSTDELVAWAEYMRVHVIVLRLGNAVDVPALGRLYQACARAGLSTALADDVMSSLQGYQRERVMASIELLRVSELRFTLLADYCQLARAVRIDDVTAEPVLLRLSAALDITSLQHEAIARYIETAEEHQDNPWYDDITAIRLALARIARVGGSVAAVCGTQAPITLRAGSAAAAFAGLTQFCRVVLDAEPLIGGEAAVAGNARTKSNAS